MATPTTDEEEQDVYVTQLKEVFESCDRTKQGYLSASELHELCNKLQLEDQASALIKQLINDDPDARVGFEEFKEGFVAVLSETVDDLDSSDEEFEEENRFTGESGEPKPVNEGKKYGRRSRPGTDMEGECTTDMSDGFSPALRTPKQEPQPRIGTSADKDSDPDELKLQLDEKDPTTFEAEGQLNQSIAEMENALDPVSEEEHLKAIWKELGVGKDGYLTMEELSTVCQHIGMDEMNDEEIRHLFEKLDVDADGHVSFQEFLHGLFQHGGPNTPRTPSTPVRPLSTPRQKLRMSLAKDPEDRMHTPAPFFTGSGMFSAIDIDNTGYMKANTIIELWDALGIPQGVEILEYLQFDLDTNINLADLSYALEQELRSVEEDNATYQAAIATYEHEIRYLKTSNDQLFGEREKLKSDISEANSRVALLIKEGDERVASMERSREKEVSQLEKKYQEQIKTLQLEIETERELLISQSTKQQHNLENEIKRLKEEENKLKDKVTWTQKDIERLESEVLEMADRYGEVERQNLRQAKELDSVGELQRKLEEMETSRENILDEHARFSEQKLKQLEGENKEIKDKNDELTMEVEDLKQQVSANRRTKKGSRARGMADPKRTGSILSDYAKPTLMQQNPGDSVSENSEDDSSSISGRKRRQLPQRPSTSESFTEEDKENLLADVKRLRDENDTMKEEYSSEINELKRGISMERKDIEEQYKLEISDLEDRHLKEIHQLEQKFDKEKGALKLQFLDDMEEKIAEKEQKIMSKFENDKRDLFIKTESEKNLIQHNFVADKAELENRLRKEFDEEVAQKLALQKELFTKQLEETVSQDRTDYDRLQRSNAETESKLAQMKEDLRRSFEKEKAEMHAKYDKDKHVLLDKHRLELMKYENAFAQGVDALDGKLKEDFYSLLKVHKTEFEKQKTKEIEEKAKSNAETHAEQVEQEKEAQLNTLEKENRQLKRDMEKGRSELIKDYEREKTTISHALTKQKLECEKMYQDKIEVLEGKLEQERERVMAEREELQRAISQERRNLEQEKYASRDQLEEELSQEIQLKLEEEFVEQIDRLKEAFGDERRELEGRIEMLQQELDELTSHHHTQETTTIHLSEFQEKMAGLNDEKDTLLEENRKIKDQLEDLMIEQREAVTRAHASNLHTGSSYRQQESEREKEIRKVLESQKRFLMEKTTELKQDIKSLEPDSKMTSTHQVHLQNLEREKEALHQELEQKNDQLAEAKTALSLSNSQHLREMQSARDKVTQMVDITRYNLLNDQLLETQQKMQELEQALEQRASETTKLMIGSQEDHQKKIRQLGEEKEELNRRLDTTTSILEDQVRKFKSHPHNHSNIGDSVDMMKYIERPEPVGGEGEQLFPPESVSVLTAQTISDTQCVLSDKQRVSSDRQCVFPADDGYGTMDYQNANDAPDLSAFAKSTKSQNVQSTNSNRTENDNFDKAHTQLVAEVEGHSANSSPSITCRKPKPKLDACVNRPYLFDPSNKQLSNHRSYNSSAIDLSSEQNVHSDGKYIQRRTSFLHSKKALAALKASMKDKNSHVQANVFDKNDEKCGPLHVDQSQTSVKEPITRVASLRSGYHSVNTVNLSQDEAGEDVGLMLRRRREERQRQTAYGPMVAYLAWVLRVAK